MSDQQAENGAITHGLDKALGGLIRDQLRGVEERHQTYRSQAEALIADLRARLAHIEALAERASRKGYDLDPYEVIDLINPPAAQWPCDNYTGPQTCLTTGCTTPCDQCRERVISPATTKEGGR